MVSTSKCERDNHYDFGQFSVQPKLIVLLHILVIPQSGTLRTGKGEIIHCYHKSMSDRTRIDHPLQCFSDCLLFKKQKHLNLTMVNTFQRSMYKNPNKSPKVRLVIFCIQTYFKEMSNSIRFKFKSLVVKSTDSGFFVSSVI